MKKVNKYLILFFLSVIFLSLSCKKEHIINNEPNVSNRNIKVINELKHEEFYVLKSCKNSRFSISITDGNYKIFDKKKIISKGIVKINRTENPNLISLGKIEGAFYKDSIVIQNYGNSMNEYIHFVQCDSKYLTFVRK